MRFEAAQLEGKDAVPQDIEELALELDADEVVSDGTEDGHIEVTHKQNNREQKP